MHRRALGDAVKAKIQVEKWCIGASCHCTTRVALDVFRNLIVPHYFTFVLGHMCTLLLCCNYTGCLLWLTARAREFNEGSWVGFHRPELADGSTPPFRQ